MKTRAEKQEKELQKILKKIYKHYDIGSDPIFDKYRKPQLVLLRFGIWTVLFEKHNWTMVEIGKVFFKTHSTISRGISNFKKNSRKKDYKKLLEVIG